MGILASPFVSLPIQQLIFSMKKNRLVLSVLTLSLLQACGGGGGGGDEGPPPIATRPSSSGTSETPPKSETPWTPPARTLAPGAELAPTLTEPQAESTFLTGNDRQGVYEDFFGYTFITSAGRLIRRTSTELFFGSIEGEGTDWSFRVPTLVRGLLSLDFVTGSGSFTAKKSMSGNYSVAGNTSRRWGPITYSDANGLAVTQSDMAGTWSVSSAKGIGMAVEIDADGKLTGKTAGDTVGVCSLTGSILQEEPSTSRNMFNVQFTASSAATGLEKACQLEQAVPYSGLAAVVMVPVSSYKEEGAYRTLTFVAVSTSGAYLSNGLRTGLLEK